MCKRMTLGRENERVRMKPAVDGKAFHIKTVIEFL